MITLKKEVQTVLSGICAHVVYGYPACFAYLPLVSWRESQNRRHAQADGREHLAEIEYTIDLFAPDSESAGEMFAAADERLSMLGLRRENSAEQFETDPSIAHITARYRCLADGQGGVYQ